MKKLFLMAVVAVFFAACQSPVDEPIDEMNLKSAKNGCTTIQSGELLSSSGEVITPGFMENGYNYQAHMYNGDYYGDGWKLVMKWNDAWLSNMDCDGDGSLDRHSGYDTYIGSGAWCTNHWTTTYVNDLGEECTYDEFTKIVAVPEDAVLSDGYWYDADGEEIGENIWGQFAIVESIINDPCAGIEGVQYKSPDHAGLGNR